MSSVRLARPLLLAAVAGTCLAWPLGDQPDLPRVLAAVALGLALAAGDGATGSQRWKLGLVWLAAPALAFLSILQRLDEPGLGLVVLVGATLCVVRAAWADAPAPERLSPRAENLVTGGFASFALLLADDLGVSLAAGLLPILAILVATALARSRSRVSSTFDVLEMLLTSPASLLVSSFAGIALLGTALLLLPTSSALATPIAFVDAAFTAVSATCVTGLIVLDTPNAFSPLGQGVLLLLIQVGGLGIMTFAAAAAVYLGRRLAIRQELLALELLGAHEAKLDLQSVLRAVLRVTFVSEGLGALALTGLFLFEGDSLGRAAWRGLFTSISAFCNAGFALQSDSLVPYAESPGVLLVLSLLIIAGGLGPLVILALPKLGDRRVALHVRLVLVVTAVLLLVPAGMYLALEWSNTLAELPLADKLVNAWFQSVTLRTAGFNSVDLAAVQPATWTLMILCMFVGGSPGSTAGGVKTTTIAVLILAVVSAVRGHREAAVFGRRIPHRTVYEAVAITTVGVLSAVGVLWALQLTQSIPLQESLFEVVSALGTVGLTVGATPKLDDVGKVIVLLAMFAGRVGPLTLFVFLVGQQRPARRYPFESVQVG